MKRTIRRILVLALMAAPVGAQNGDETPKTPEQIRQEKLIALQSLVNSGNMAFRNEDFGRAENAYRNALRATDPPLPYEQRAVVRGNLANTCYRMEKWGAAIEAYRSSELEDAIQWIGQCHVQLGNYPEAALALRESLVLFPERTQLREQLAQIMAMLGEDRESLRLYEQLLVERPVDPTLYRAIANRHLSMGDSVAALDTLEMAWRLGDRKAATSRLLGDLYMGQGMRLEAAGYYSRHFAAAENATAEDEFRIGLAYYQSGEFVSARSFFDQAVERDSSYAHAFVYLGHLAFAAGDDDVALTEFGKAIEKDPSQVAAHEAIGSIQLQRGNPASAVAAFQSAIDLGGASFSTHYNLIQSHLGLGQAAEATAALKRAFHVYPERQELTGLLSAIKRKRSSS